MADILIVLIVFSAVVAIVKMSLDYARWKRSGGRSTGRELTTSELTELIDSSVEKATLTLAGRVAALEERENARIAGSTSVRQIEASIEQNR